MKDKCDKYTYFFRPDKNRPEERGDYIIMYNLIIFKQ